jgi:hypothetical protein
VRSEAQLFFIWSESARRELNTPVRVVRKPFITQSEQTKSWAWHWQSALKRKI